MGVREDLIDLLRVDRLEVVLIYECDRDAATLEVQAFRQLLGSTCRCESARSAGENEALHGRLAAGEQSHREANSHVGFSSLVVYFRAKVPTKP